MRLIHRSRYPILKLLSLYKEFDPNNNFMIFSEPRGGSTWLAQMIKTVPRTALIWEPINPKVYQELRKINFGWRQYIPENDKWQEAEDFFKQIFIGNKLSYHTSSFLTVCDLIKAEQLLIKFVRGNALLPWITKQYNLIHKPIYLVRHPFAVAQSQLKHGAWKSVTPQIDITKLRYHDRFLKYLPFLESIKTIEEKLVASWCLANKFTLENVRNNRDWITIYYEHLVSNPRFEIERIFNSWALPIPKQLYSVMEQPSKTVRNNDLRFQTSTQISKWETYFDKEVLLKMNDVLKNFEINNYNMDSYLPL